MDDNWKYYHELGHGIIAHIFNGYFLNFEYLTFKLNDKKFNSRDQGYTYSSPFENKDDIIQEDIQKAVLVDGLYLLSGIIGATYLDTKNEEIKHEITPKNHTILLDYRGSDGDFEIINRGNRPFGWSLNKLDFLNENKINLHCKLYNILRELFIKPEIQAGIESLYNKLMLTKILYPNDFQEVFDSAFTEKIKTDLINMLSKELFGDITNINYDKASFNIEIK